MLVTIESKLEGKYPSVIASGKKYGVTLDLFKQLEMGKSYEVVAKEKKVPNKSKEGEFFTFHDILVAVLAPEPVKTNPSAVSGHPGGQESIEKMSKAKNDNISRCCALNNTAILVEAYARIGAANNMFAGMNAKEVQDYLLALKRTILNENCNFLGVEQDVEF